MAFVLDESLTTRNVGETAAAGSEAGRRTRPSDLSKSEHSIISVSVSTEQRHTSTSDDLEGKACAVEVAAAGFGEESETEFISRVPRNGRHLDVERGVLQGVRSYGTTPQTDCNGPAASEGSNGGGEKEPLLPASQRKQSAAVAGKAFEKIASRNKRAKHATTNIETAMHLLKGNIGIGLLALPLAVYNAGLIVGAVGLLVMGLIATHCMMQLVTCAKELCRRLGVETLDYAELAQFAVLESTEKPFLGNMARHMVNLFLLITQFGFCCAYFVFMAYSLDQVFCVAFNVNIGQRAWIGVLMVPVIVLSWIRNLNELAYFSMVANFCIFVTLAIILYEEITSLITLDDDDRAAVLKGPLDLVSIATLPLFFGKAVYAYEGIGIILPLENKMKRHEDALKVIFFSMMVVTLLFTLFGVVGYIVYGDDIKASITLNLISSNIVEDIFYIIAKIFFAYATLASFLLQFYVPMDFLEPAILEQMKMNNRNSLKFIIQISFRSVVVLFTAGIAMAVPDLEDLISLIGAVASSTLALIFPSLLSILIFWRVRHDTLWLGCLPWHVWVVKDLMIALLGVVGSVFGTYASIDNIVTYFKQSNAAEKACIITYFPS